MASQPPQARSETKTIPPFPAVANGASRKAAAPSPAPAGPPPLPAVAEEPGARLIDLTRPPEPNVSLIEPAPLKAFPTPPAAEARRPAPPPAARPGNGGPAVPPPLPPSAAWHWLLGLAAVWWMGVAVVLGAPLPLALAAQRAGALAPFHSAVTLVFDHLLVPLVLLGLALGSVAGRWRARSWALAAATAFFAVVLTGALAQVFFLLRDGPVLERAGTVAALAGTALLVLSPPWALIALYGSRGCRRVCEVMDGGARPVHDGVMLAAVICLLAARVCLGRMGENAFHLFGQVWSGAAAQAAWLASALLFGVAAWLNVRRRVTGWWLALLGLGAVGSSGIRGLLEMDGRVLWRLRLFGRQWELAQPAVDTAFLLGAYLLLAFVLLFSVLQHYRKPAA